MRWFLEPVEANPPSTSAKVSTVSAQRRSATEGKRNLQTKGGYQKARAIDFRRSPARGIGPWAACYTNCPLGSWHIPRLHTRRRQPNCDLPTVLYTTLLGLILTGYDGRVIKVGPASSTLDLRSVRAADGKWYRPLPFLGWDRERAGVDGFIEGGATLFERRSYKQHRLRFFHSDGHAAFLHLAAKLNSHV